MRKNSIKNTRINQEVLRVLSSVIRHDMKDPRIAVMTSVTDVIVAPDLKTCKVYISVLGDEDTRRNTMKGLRSAEGFIRSRLAAELNLRHTPVLTFLEDTSIEYGVKMTKLLEEVTHEDNSGNIDE